MSKKRMAEIEAMLRIHTKQAELLRGKEQRAKELRVFHEKSAACLQEMLEEA